MGLGKFITLEGGEGVGKSSNVDYIKEYLTRRGCAVITTREPGGTELGERIRALLLDVNQESITEEVELLLIFAARAQHLKQLIRPAINSGKWVVCDRFTDASYAYQGGGRGIRDNKIEYLEKWVQRGYVPDLTLLLDAPINVGLERAGRRGVLDRFELEQRDFFNRVRNRYIELSEQFPKRIKCIDASQSLVSVQSEIAGHLDQFFEN